MSRSPRSCCGTYPPKSHTLSCPSLPQPAIPIPVDLVPGLPPSLRPTIRVSSEQLASFEAKAKLWKKDKHAFLDDVEHRLLVHMQIMDHIILNPPGGRLGASVVARAAQQYATMASNVLAALERAKTINRVYESEDAEEDDTPSSLKGDFLETVQARARGKTTTPNPKAGKRKATSNRSGDPLG